MIIQGVHKLSLQFSKFVKILSSGIFLFDLFYSEGKRLKYFFLNRYLWKQLGLKLQFI